MSSDRRKKWKQKVADAATKAWTSGPPANAPIKLSIVKFYEEKEIDVDNMIKPIQDALLGIVYENDVRILDVVASKRDIAEVKIENPSLILLKALRNAKAKKSSKDFVYIKAELITDVRILRI